MGVSSLFLLQVIFPNPGMELGSPALKADSLPTELSGMPCGLPASAGDRRDTGSILGLGGSPGGGHGNPLQYSCLQNPKDRESAGL